MNSTWPAESVIYCRYLSLASEFTIKGVTGDKVDTQ